MWICFLASGLTGLLGADGCRPLGEGTQVRASGGTADRDEHQRADDIADQTDDD